MNKEEKLKELEKTILGIEKNFGKGSIVQLGDNKIERIPAISSGSISLDCSLGIGGYAKGRIIEIYGPESSGKTTLTLSAVANAQANGGIAAFVDSEHCFDMQYAKNLGVNINELWLSQPDNGEQALEIVESLVDSNVVDIIIVDSVAALTPKAEIEGEMGDSHMGLQARLMSQALRKLTAKVAKSKTCLIFTNQLRMKIGVMFGSPETTTGGKALKFYASQRLDIRKIETVMENGKESEALANKVKVKVVKNKVAPPFRTCEFEIEFGKGINKLKDLIEVGVYYKIIEKSGSWYSYKDTKLGQGKDKVCDYLRENNDLKLEIDKLIRQEAYKSTIFNLESKDDISNDTENKNIVTE